MFLWTHESSYKNYAFFGIFFILLIGYTNQYQKKLQKKNLLMFFYLPITYEWWLLPITTITWIDC